MRQSRNDIAIPPGRFPRHRTMTILLRSQQSSIAEQSMSPHVADINRFSYDAVHSLLGGIFEHDLHAKRIDSLCNATIGVLHSASLAVSAIGHGLAAARGLSTKHAIKQIDRLLSNDGIKVDDILALWVPFVIGARTSIVVAMDWTDGACPRALDPWDADNQTTIMLSLVTDHGRATPLCG